MPAAGPEVSVECRRAGDGWICTVGVGGDAGRTTHEVTVGQADLERLGAGTTDPTELVAASFDFLLAREPREAILRRFELPVIERYFPDYRAEIGRLLAARR